MNIADRIQSLRKSKGISQEELADKIGENQYDARIFSLVGTVINFVGLVAAIIIWKERQTPVSVAVGIIVMAIGCMIFAIGQLIGNNKKKASFTFWLINIWLLSLMPISCVFNCIQGISGGHWWTLTPTPQFKVLNSISNYGLCWLSYFVVCVVFDIVMLKRAKR